MRDVLVMNRAKKIAVSVTRKEGSARRVVANKNLVKRSPSQRPKAVLMLL
jgi:hypothetical protein